MKKFMETAHSINSIDLLAQSGNRFYKASLILVAIYGFFFSVLDFTLGDHLQSAINITLVPVALISYLLFKAGNTITSKVLNLSFVIIIISLHSLIRSPQSMILAFFIPVIVSILIVFQGETRRIGYFLTFFVIIVFVLLITTKYSINDGTILTADLIRREWMMNLPGALVVTIWEVIFILSINNSIQNELLAKTHDLSKINDSLNSIIKTREKLISILSHDFRGPVISIKAGLEMLYEDELDTIEEINPRKKKIYTELIKKTKSTIKLMDDLLLWSRSQTSQINCETEINSLEEIEEILIDYCGFHSGAKNITFNIDIPKKGSVLSDKKLLNGILLNLISNAVKFSNTNGHIDVLAKHNENQWTFSIADNGIGIEKEVLERIQNGQYYTSNGTDNERGHGLGLQLVREFLDKHDSNLEITSEVGKGTTMSFNLSAA